MRCFPSMFWTLVFGELQYPVCCVIWNSAPPLNIFYRTAGPHISIILLYFKPQLFRRSWLRFSSPGARWTVLGQRLVGASNQGETRGAPSIVRPPLLSPDALSPDRSYPRGRRNERPKSRVPVPLLGWRDRTPVSLLLFYYYYYVYHVYCSCCFYDYYYHCHNFYHYLTLMIIIFINSIVYIFCFCVFRFCLDDYEDLFIMQCHKLHLTSILREVSQRE